MDKATEKSRRYTKYEEARIIGARALQISMNAPILLKISKEELEKINYNPLDISELEYAAGVLPITVKKPMPKKKKHLRLAEDIPEIEEEEEVKQQSVAEIAESVEGEEVEEELTSEGEVESDWIKFIEYTHIFNRFY